MLTKNRVPFFSPADFLTKVVTHFTRKGIPVEFIQTDNGFEFIYRFINNKCDLELIIHYFEDVTIC